VPADNHKGETRLLVEFHCHTRDSHDGFTTASELLAECLRKKINVVAITEHDRMCCVSVTEFAAHGITVIPSCEYTTEENAHVVGLFVSGLECSGLPAIEVARRIKTYGGIILIPHPFKLCSGIMARCLDPGEVLELADLIELFNGGFHDHSKNKRVCELAASHNLRIVAASDCHKAKEVGFYVTRYSGVTTGVSLKEVLVERNGELCRDENWQLPPRRNTAVQKLPFYESILRCIPWSWKRSVKLYLYARTQRSYRPKTASYKPID
jgi:hypothetical protein